MTQLEWWYSIDPGFVAYYELLSETFATTIAGYHATVHLPSVNVDDGVAASWLAPPQIDDRPPARSQECWGMVHIGSKEKPVGVVVRQLALTADAPGDDIQQAAESIVAAMDEWWDNVCGWLEIVTGQHLTQVGHREIEVIGNKTPVWTLQADALHGTPISIAGQSVLRPPGQVEEVSAETLGSCVALATTAPPFAWLLLRDARALHQDGHHRRAVIDAATSAELAVSEILDARLAQTEESVRDALLAAHRMLGPKSRLLSALGCPPLPHAFQSDLVDQRNRAVHKGISIDGQTCGLALAVAAEVVERAYPLPTPPGAAPLRRLWGRPPQANMHV